MMNQTPTIHKFSTRDGAEIYCGKEGVSIMLKTRKWDRVTCTECRAHEQKFIDKIRGKKWFHIFGDSRG